MKYLCPSTAFRVAVIAMTVVGTLTLLGFPERDSVQPHDPEDPISEKILILEPYRQQFSARTKELLSEFHGLHANDPLSNVIAATMPDSHPYHAHVDKGDPLFGDPYYSAEQVCRKMRRAARQADDYVIQTRTIRLKCSANYLGKLRHGANDPRYPQQIELPQLRIGTTDSDPSASAWDYTEGSRSVIVGLIDSGVTTTDPDISNNLWINPNEIAGNGRDDDGNGYIDDIHGGNVVLRNGFIRDYANHGHDVASIIGAEGDNNYKTSGVNKRVTILPVVITTRTDGYITLEWALSAIDYLLNLKRNHGIDIRIVNNSWGCDTCGNGDVIRAKLQETLTAGFLMIVAAPNSYQINLNNIPAYDYPLQAGLPNHIGVGAVRKVDYPYPWALASGHGTNWVHIGAPLWATSPSSARIWGTSIATPYVSGVAALIQALRPEYSWIQIKEALFAGATVVTGLQNFFEGGRVLNGLGSVAYALGIPVPTPAPTYTPTTEPVATPEPTATPWPTDAPYVPPTPEPTSTPWPTSPPFVYPTNPPTAVPTARPVPLSLRRIKTRTSCKLAGKTSTQALVTLQTSSNGRSWSASTRKRADRSGNYFFEISKNQWRQKFRVLIGRSTTNILSCS